MKTNITELVFILDKSGSMSGLESDTIGGFNSMLKNQKAESGKAFVTTVLFDNNYEILHEREDIRDTPFITDKEYFVEGSTALLDALGKTINKVVNVQKNKRIEERADKVLFVIITDGMENASREYTAEKVKGLVELEKEKYGWEFMFLGANLDAVSTAKSYGIDKNRAVNYRADSKGTQTNFKAVNHAVSELRNQEFLSDDWRKTIDEDYNSRG